MASISIMDLPTEVIQKIYEYTKLHDLFHLAQTCKRHYRTFVGRRNYHLQRSMHNSYAPLADLYRLAVSNEPDRSRKPLGTEIRRNMIVNRLIETSDLPRLTIGMSKKMIAFGRVADRWTELYPQIRWRHNSNERRLLRTHEQVLLRGAIYRYWIYNVLFHDSTFTHFEPDFPRTWADPRLRIIRTYSTLELLQLVEYTDKMRQLLQIDLYPSYAVIRDSYTEPVPPKMLVALGWGSGTFHHRLVYDLMKYDPADFLHLFDKTSCKKERMDYLMARGISFADRPATLRDSVVMVLLEREVKIDNDLDGHNEDIKDGIIDSPETSSFTNSRYVDDSALVQRLDTATTSFWADGDEEDGGGVSLF